MGAIRNTLSSIPVVGASQKLFVFLFFGAIKGVIRKIGFWAMVATAVISALIMYVAENAEDTASFAGLSRASWFNVAGSLLATALFLFIQGLINLVRGAEEAVYKDKYQLFVEQHGLKDLFQQRGSGDAVHLYGRLIESARARVWAAGMTNRHFADQHSERLGDLLRARSVDVVVAFWEPRAFLITREPDGAKHRILSVQSTLEHSQAQEWDTVVANTQRRIGQVVGSPITGTLRILNISHVCNFSCLIIDDDVFFFPFLAGPDSTNDPTIHCRADIGIGKAIVDHLAELFAAPAFSRRVS